MIKKVPKRSQPSTILKQSIQYPQRMNHLVQSPPFLISIKTSSGKSTSIGNYAPNSTTTSPNLFKVLMHQKRVDKNKIMTQLRLHCSQKQSMFKIYANAMAIIKLKANSESRNSHKIGYNPHLITTQKIDKIMKQRRKGKITISAKFNKIQHHDRNLKSQTKILSTGYDDSDGCLKTLVSKIENMIQIQYNFGNNNNILHEISGIKFNEQSNDSMPFDGSHIKISQITHAKNQLQYSTQTTNVKLPKQQTKKNVYSPKNKFYPHKIGKTEPVVPLKPTIVNEYGMMMYPQRDTQIKVPKRAFRKKKNDDTSNSSLKKSKSLSGSLKRPPSLSRRSHKNEASKSSKRKEEPYLQKKTKRKQTNRMKSPK